MGNLQSNLKPNPNKLKVIKRIINFLSIALDLQIVRAVIKKAQNAGFALSVTERLTAVKASYTFHCT